MFVSGIPNQFVFSRASWDNDPAEICLRVALTWLRRRHTSLSDYG